MNKINIDSNKEREIERDKERDKAREIRLFFFPKKISVIKSNKS